MELVKHSAAVKMRGGRFCRKIYCLEYACSKLENLDLELQQEGAIITAVIALQRTMQQLIISLLGTQHHSI